MVQQHCKHHVTKSDAEQRRFSSSPSFVAPPSLLSSFLNNDVTNRCIHLLSQHAKQSLNLSSATSTAHSTPAPAVGKHHQAPTHFDHSSTTKPNVHIHNNNLNQQSQFEKPLVVSQSISTLKGVSEWLLPITGSKSVCKTFSSCVEVRRRVSHRLFEYFNEHLLNNTLESSKVLITWNKRLCKTAGITYIKYNRNKERIATIELSIKVLDEPDRLYNTLAHETCHVLTWIIDGIANPPHGQHFKKWASLFHQWDHSLIITTCHNYHINYRFNYICSNCGLCYGRHSKSINTNKKVCGICKSKGILELFIDESIERN